MYTEEGCERGRVYCDHIGQSGKLVCQAQGHAQKVPIDSLTKEDKPTQLAPVGKMIAWRSDTAMVVMLRHPETGTKKIYTLA